MTTGIKLKYENNNIMSITDNMSLMNESISTLCKYIDGGEYVKELDETKIVNSHMDKVIELMTIY